MKDFLHIKTNGQLFRKHYRELYLSALTTSIKVDPLADCVICHEEHGTEFVRYFGFLPNYPFLRLFERLSANVIVDVFLCILLEYKVAF